MLVEVAPVFDRRCGRLQHFKRRSKTGATTRSLCVYLNKNSSRDNGLHPAEGTRLTVFDHGAAALNPPVIFTAFASIFAVEGARPSRVAVTVIAPAVSVERTATRLMPHSVLR